MKLESLLARRMATEFNFTTPIVGICPAHGVAAGDCWQCRSLFNCIGD